MNTPSRSETPSRCSIASTCAQSPHFSRGRGSSLPASLVSFFTVCSQLEICISPILTAAGLVIEFLQLVALFINPQFSWSRAVSSHLAYAVYAVLLPLFDPLWIPDTTVAAIVFFWIVQAIFFFVVVTFVSCYLSQHNQFSTTVQVVESYVVHAMSSFLWMPVAHLLLSFMVCDSEHNRMFWYSSDFTCRGGFAISHLVFGILGLICHSVMGFVTCGMLFDDQISSKCWMARPHSMAALSYATLRLLYCITFHTLLSSGYRQSFAIVVLVGSCWYVLLECGTLPVFRSYISRLRCGFHLCVAWVALLAAITPSVENEDRWIDGGSGSAIALAVGLPVLFCVGLLLPSIRVNRKLADALAMVRRGVFVNDTIPCYPHFLPRSDLTFSPHKALEAELNPQANAEQNLQPRNVSFKDEQETANEEPASVILRPFINCVVLPTDVELSTRFLPECASLQHNSQSALPGATLAFAFRLYTKGIVKFHRSFIVSLHFAHFLLQYARRPHLALNETEGIASRADLLSAVTLYGTYKLQTKIRTMLNMSGTSHLKLLRNAVSLHREILTHMAAFWSSLSHNSSLQQQASIADLITARREAAVQAWKRALHQANRDTLIKYALFLQQIVLNPTAAKSVLDYVADEESAANRSVSNRSDMGGGSSSGKSRAVATAEGEIDMWSASRSSDRHLSIAVHVMFALLVLLAGAFVILGAVRDVNESHQIDRFAAIGEARTLVTLGGYYSMELDRVWSNSSELSSDVSQLESCRAALVAIISQLNDLYNTLTHGSLKTSFPLFVDFTTADRIAVMDASLDDQNPYLHRISTSNFWTLWERLSYAFSVVAANSTTQSSTTYRNALEFIRLNVPNSGAFAFNATVSLFLEKGKLDKQVNFWVVTALYIFAFFMSYSVLLIISMNVQEIAATSTLR